MTTRPFTVRGAKINLLDLQGAYDDLLGKPLDRTKFTPWSEVIAQLKADGVNLITLGVSAGVMRNATDSSFDPVLDFNPEYEAIRKLAELIKANDMSVALSTFVNMADVITGDTSSGGKDRPYPADPKAWLTTFQASVLSWASFANEIGASAFTPFMDETQHLFENSELTSGWLSLISGIRKVYSGDLSTNWWTPGHGNSITAIPKAIIAELDYIGLGLFPDLTLDVNASVTDLASAYYKDVHGNDIIAFLEGLSEAYGKQIWISDKAFHSFDGAAYDEGRIFNPSIPLSVDLEEQARLYDSFLQVMSRDGGEWFTGVSFQNFNNIKDTLGILPRYLDGPMSESPQDKPAEVVMANWFNGLRQTNGLVESDGDRASNIKGGYHHDVLSGGAGNDTIAGLAGNDQLTGGPAVVAPSTAFKIDIDLRGVHGHGMVPMVRVRDAQGAAVLTQAIEAQLGQVSGSEPTRISFFVSDLSGFAIEQTNWTFFDMSDTGNIFVRIEAVYVNGDKLDLTKALTYVPPSPFPVQQGRIDSVHGGKFSLDLRDVTATPLSVQWTDNDVLIGGVGDDVLDGGAGLDTAVFSGQLANFKVAANAAGFSVTDTIGMEGADQLLNIERIKFADGAIALDIEGSAGQAYRIYQAAFDRAPDRAGLGYWMHALDEGVALKSVAEGFVNSLEFRALYGTSPTNAEIVAKFYQNVLDRAGEPAGINYWAGVLDSDAASLVDVLIGFSESAENKLALVGVTSNGFAYTPFV